MNAPPLQQADLRLVVMGVSGCGKSTLSAALAPALNLQAIDGDDLHLPESVRKMAAGVPLADEDRWPWLDRVAASLRVPATSGLRGSVVACSALKLAYRQHLRERVPGLRFIFLAGDAVLLSQRMAQRTGHFMQLQMLESQLKTLETPGPAERDVLTLAADQPLPDQVAQVVSAARGWNQLADN